jgi:hypothetical protein
MACVVLPDGIPYNRATRSTNDIIGEGVVFEKSRMVSSAMALPN